MSTRIDLPLGRGFGRHVNHDDRSRDYPVRPTATTLAPVRHASYIPILDQGNTSSCTGNAGLSCIYHAPYGTNGASWPSFPNTELGAVSLYSQATRIDSFRGTYPPNDSGSDGLSIAKVLKAAGVISSYQWAFSLAQALAQLQQTPLITGLPWYNSMSRPGPDGLLKVDRRSGLNGGHEICVDEYVPATGGQPDKVGGPNSWGTRWGNQGRWYLTVTDWGGLLSENGDVTAFTK